MDWWEEDLEGARFGDYRIERKLGEGGMAEVFLAVGLPSGVHSGRRVAIKVPLLAQVAPASLKYLLARFEKEVLLQSEEAIPGVVTMLGAGEARDRHGVARPYLVMEYLTGGTLADRLGRNEPLLDYRRERLQTLEEVLEWLPSIARTLDALHRCIPQRLHRDVKPENILFNRAGDPFLSDFGIATLLNEEGSGSLAGSLVGTPGSPGYQAPETYSGEKLAASDQFGLGVTVYEALSGHLPVKARTANDYIQKTANWNPTLLQAYCPALPKAAVQVVMQAIAADSGQRHINCMTFARALHRAANSATQGNGINQEDIEEVASKPSQLSVPPRSAQTPRARDAHEPGSKVKVGKPAGYTGGETSRRFGAMWWGALGLMAVMVTIAGIFWITRPPVPPEPVPPPQPPEAGLAREAGRVFRDRLRDGSEGPSMVLIQAGRFMQGSPATEEDRDSDEGAQQEVAIRSFAIGKFPVTKAEFAAFVDSTNHITDAERGTPVPGQDGTKGCYAYKGGTDFDWVPDASWRNPGFPQGDDHPATCLSWNDAVAFAEWLRDSTGKPYRLATESETEYVTRAGSSDRYPWGEDSAQACRYANVGDAAFKRQLPGMTAAACDDGYLFTSPVGNFQANAFGLHDTIGNVWKWTQDCGARNDDGAPADGRTQQSKGCDLRVLRGASWDSSPAELRSANRVRFVPAFRYVNTGLRVAQDL